MSYRRKEPNTAQQVYQHLISRFGANYIFVDQHVLQGGDDFEQQIQSAADRCEVFIALIDGNWIKEFSATRFKSGRDRDWLKIELETVLSRNRNRLAGTPSPVLIVPLRTGGLKGMARARLPESLQDFARLQQFDFGNAEDVRSMDALIVEHLGEPPMGQHELPIRMFDDVPRLDYREQYRLRFARSPSDIQVFVKMSADDPTIAGANMDLASEQRWELYERWCAASALREDIGWHATGNQVRSFLMLEQRQADESWQPVGLTIILPLTEEGGQYLMTNPGTNDKRNASHMPASMIARSATNCLLLDTWIIAPKPSRKSTANRKPARIEHHGFGRLMVPRHLAELWDPSVSRETIILAEPDNPQIERIIQQLCFRRINRPGVCGDIFEFTYPLSPYRYAPDQRRQIDQIVGRLPILKQKWAII